FTAILRDAAPMSAETLFYSIYAAIYFVGIALAFFAAAIFVKSMARGRNRRARRMMLLFGVALSAPSAFHIVQPYPLDSVQLRFFMIIIVWSVIMAALRVEARRQRGDRS
ncbi:MAG: hypothetical protein AAGJ87_17425, partial [Pseudomonadota bacterium]